jgi:hypothetical protein
MKNLPKEKRDRLILVGIGTLVMVAALYYGVIAMQRNALLSTAKAKADLLVKLGEGQRLLGSSVAIEKGLESATARRKTIEATLPSGDMYSWIISTVNAFKEKYDVDIPQFSREVPTTIGVSASFPYKAAMFTLRGTAYFHELGRFISDFENTFPYMRIQNIEIEPNPAGSTATPADSEKLLFKIEVVTPVNIPN